MSGSSRERQALARIASWFARIAAGRKPLLWLVLCGPIAILHSTIWGQVPSATTRKPQTSEAGLRQKADLSGVVRDATNNRPIPGAKIFVFKDDPRVMVAHGRVRVSDGQGGFTFRTLSPGRYYLTGEHQGYLKDFFISNGGWDDKFLLKPGEKRTVTLNLVPESSIKGRVLDDAGRPLANVSVTAIREEYVHGVRFWKQYRYWWEPPVEASTNKDGEYRVGHLRPGKYYLEAYYKPEDKAGPSALARGYLPVYFPATTRLSSATAFLITAGEERDADFHLESRRTYRVHGRLLLPLGAARSGPLWCLTDARGALVQHWAETYDRDSKSFELGPLVPGNYLLSVSLGIYDTDPAAWQSFDITDADINGLVLSLHPSPIALDANVHVPYELPSEVPLSVLRLQRDGEEFDESGEPLSKGGKMSFTRLQPGHYRVYLLTDEPVYLQSAHLGDQDAMAGGITIDGSPKNVLEINIGRATGEVEGAVASADGAKALGADVKLIAQGQDSRFVLKSVQADSDGQFRFAGVPPGTYGLVALNRLVRDVELGPLELARLRGGTKQFVVGDSTRLTVQLQLSTFHP